MENSNKSEMSQQSLFSEDAFLHNDSGYLSGSTPICSMEAYNNSCSEFDGSNYPHSSDVKRVLREKFGLEEFQSIQLPVINAALLGHDCFVIMPTGGLKSLCYQLPAILTEGCTVVIAPVKSLIFNQLTKLKSLNICARHFSGDQTSEEEIDIQSDIESSNVKILYVTPEKLEYSYKIMSFLQELYSENLISRFVIDEAHCVSESHEFRVSCNLAKHVREHFPNVKIMAFTATARPSVRLDIIKQLKLEKAKIFVTGLNRSNLKYSVLPKNGDTMEEIKKFIRSQPATDSGIIFCFKKVDCDIMADNLNSANISARPYHSDISDNQREFIQKDWLTNKVRVICATIAFGMGIDKPDVRFVLHYTMPKTIENYFQETGRAGHDGKLANCILYYNADDFEFYQFILNVDQYLSRPIKKIRKEDLWHMVCYCTNYVDCRRSQLLDYFGENFNRDDCLINSNTACDNCLNPKKYKYEKINALESARKIIKECRENSKLTLSDILDKFLLDWVSTDVKRLIVFMIRQEYLLENVTLYGEGIGQAYIELGPKYEIIMNEDINLEFYIRELEESVNKFYTELSNLFQSKID